MAKIGIDARLWGTKHTGIGRYVEELVENLVRIDRQNTYVIFCRRGDFDSITVGKKWKRVIADIPHYSLLEQLFLPFIFWKEKLDLLHVPHFNLPILYPGRAVVTIHDILWHRTKGPEATTLSPLVYSIKHLGYKAAVSSAVSKAAKIIVPSRAVADEIARQFGLTKNKIVVTYEGVPPKPRLAGRRGIERSKLLQKYQIKKPYLLYVGALYPHKNVERLVQSIKQIGGVDLVVVCARDVFWDRFTEFLEKEHATKYVNLVGYVTDGQLADLYRSAQAFVFPTLSEGFGLPGLEAMAYGTPVVCSDIPVLREVYGDAALYFDPGDPGDIASKIVLVLTDRRLRKELILKGRQRVKKYSWRKMAQQTAGVYDEVLR